MLFPSAYQNNLSQKLPGQLLPMTGAISEVVTPKDKTKSNPLAQEKVRILSKSVVSSQSFPVSLKGVFKL